MMDLSDEKRKIIQAVTTAQRKRRKVKEIEKHQSLVREARSTTSVLGFISISAPRIPTSLYANFLPVPMLLVFENLLVILKSLGLTTGKR